MKKTWLLPVENVAVRFLRAVADCLTGDITICFEHAFPESDAVTLFKRHQSTRIYEAMRDTIDPHAELFYCNLTPDFACELSRLASIHESSNLFWHVKGYDEQCMIFAVHDAYGSAMACLSGDIPEGNLQRLAAVCGEQLVSEESCFDWDRPRRIDKANKPAQDNP